MHTHTHTQQTRATLWVIAISQVAQKRSFEVKRSSEYASICFCTLVSARTHNNARTLNLLSWSLHYSCSQRWVGAKYQTNGSSNDPGAESCTSQNTPTHNTAFWYLFTRGVVAQSYLLRTIIKHRSCKQTRRAQKWKRKVSREETLFIFIQLLAHIGLKKALCR